MVIESVKAASDILRRSTARSSRSTTAIADNPGLVNEDPLGAAWFFKMKIEDLAALDDFMDEDAYKDFIE